jgi:hypothetical protein
MLGAGTTGGGGLLSRPISRAAVGGLAAMALSRFMKR